MGASATKSTLIRDQQINIRANQRERDIIDQAAQVLGKNRSDFMLETAYKEATQVLLDQVFFPLESRAFEQFRDLVDSPPPPTAELRRLLNTSSPWE